MKTLLLMMVGTLLVSPAAPQQNLVEVDPTPGGAVESIPQSINEGVVTFYTDRGSFQADNPGLTLEDFETPLHPKGSGVIVSCPEPADAGGSTGCYLAEELEEGFSMTSPGAGLPGAELVLVEGDAGFGTPVGVILGSNTFPASARIDFSPPVSAVGFDLVTLIGGVPADITLLDVDGATIDGQTGVPGGAGGSFWGAASPTPIAGILIEDPTGGDVELLDDMEFGTPEVSVALQSISIDEIE